MDHKTLKDLDRQYVMQTYGRFDVDIDHKRALLIFRKISPVWQQSFQACTM